jgi:predicted permease
MLLGIICGATGLGKIVLNSAAGGIVTSVISMITAPTSALVLIVVGYELNMKKSLLKKVAQTVVFRLVIMIVLLIGVSWIVTALFGYDKELQVALMVLYALPAPFIIPMFADLGEDSEYVSTTLSLNTVITMILFVFISYFYLM